MAIYRKIKISKYLPEDYQWPNQCLSYPEYINSFKLKSRENIIKKIEEYFEKLFNVNAVLMPSGRSALTQILNYHKIDRSNLVFTTRWSSHCLFHAIGAFSNVSTNFFEHPDLILANHKWGIPVKVKNIYD